MELGQRLRQARLEAGLSQRQLCGDVITRNMLSQIENGTARPGMDTLRYLAARLGKSVSFFLEEQALESPNAQVMARVRQAFDAGDFAGAAEALKAFREPDEVFGREKALTEQLCWLALAEQAQAEGRSLYALELLERADRAAVPEGFRVEAARRRLLLLARIQNRGTMDICSQLPSLDEELMLRAGAALASGDPARGAALLEAAEDHSAPRWNLLRGRACLALEDFSGAAEFLHRAEAAYPEVLPLLEQCYREMGDYRRAYEYACRQKK